jgi:hypothetical protein
MQQRATHTLMPVAPKGPKQFRAGERPVTTIVARPDSPARATHLLPPRWGVRLAIQVPLQGEQHRRSIWRRSIAPACFVRLRRGGRGHLVLSTGMVRVAQSVAGNARPLRRPANRGPFAV